MSRGLAATVHRAGFDRTPRQEGETWIGLGRRLGNASNWDNAAVPIATDP